MSGFLSGTFWGGIVGAGALVVSSLALDRQELSMPQPEASAVEVPGGSEFDQARPEAEPVLPTAESRPQADPVATVEAPEDAVDDPPALDTAALDEPEPELDAPGGLGDAPEVEEDEQPAISTDEAVEAALSDSLEEPEVPGGSPDAEVDSPAALETEDSGEAEAGVETSSGEDASEGDMEVAALPDASAETEQPQAGTLPLVDSQADAPTLTQPEVTEEAALPGSTPEADTSLGEAPEAPRLPQVTEEPSLPEAGDAPDSSEASTGLETPEAETSGGAESIRVDGGESLLEPVEDLQDQAEGVETGRLPQAGTDNLPRIRRIGVDAETDAAEEADETASLEGGEAEIEEDSDPSGPALQAFGTVFENPEGRPLLSVVLVHTDAQALGAEVLEGLPVNIGFAIDAGSPGAAELAKSYRDAGREVVLIPSLPEGALPQDVEQAMRVNLETVPEAVAVMDVSGASFQSDRAVVQQVVDLVTDTGHGLITFPRGLNTAHQEAQRAGVPTGLIFRNLDGGSETQEQIRRALDRAAFRARQNEGVILVGTTKGTTLGAIVEWALGNRAANVTIAPVSAALAADN